MYQNLKIERGGQKQFSRKTTKKEAYRWHLRHSKGQDLPHLSDLYPKHILIGDRCHIEALRESKKLHQCIIEINTKMKFPLRRHRKKVKTALINWHHVDSALVWGIENNFRITNSLAFFLLPYQEEKEDRKILHYIWHLLMMIEGNIWKKKTLYNVKCH